MDYNKLISLCLQYQIEVETEGNGFTFVAPEEPSAIVKAQISSIIPEDTKYEFRIGPKRSTLQAIDASLKGADFKGFMLPVARTLVIYSVNEIDEDHNAWIDLPAIIKKDGFFKCYQITFGDKVLIYGKEVKTIKQHTEQIKSVNKKEQKQERDCCFTEDDILNLRISLNQDKDASEIIKDLE